MKKHLPQIIVLMIILAIAGGYFYYITHKNDNKNILTLYGNIDIRQVNLSFRIPGRIASMPFEEGDEVKAGQVISVLDPKPYLDEYAKAVGNLDNSKANYLKYQNGSRPQDIKVAEASLNEKKAAYEVACILYSRERDVQNIGSISKQKFSETEAQAKEAEAQLKSAEEQLNLLQEGFRHEDVLAAKAQVEVARANLDSTKTNLSDTKILAPRDGTILTRIQEPGAIVAAGSPVYSLSLFNPIWVRAYISEVNLGDVYPGMKAEIFTDSRPNNPYIGQIGFISPVAEFTPKNVETTELRTDLVYRLRIIITDTDKFLRQGMPVTVKLKLEKKHGK